MSGDTPYHEIRWNVENSCRTHAPRHTLPAFAGRHDDENLISLTRPSVNNPNPIMQSERVVLGEQAIVSKKGWILLANSNQWYFNKLVKIPCHKTPSRCPHCLNLSSQSSRSCAGPNIKVLKDKDLEFANSNRPIFPDKYWRGISPFFPACLCIK
jgi:hypothetical protein